MSNDAERFRSRAEQCRRLAVEARDDNSRQALTELAAQLDHEAEQIEDEAADRRGA